MCTGGSSRIVPAVTDWYAWRKASSENALPRRKCTDTTFVACSFWIASSIESTIECTIEYSCIELIGDLGKQRDLFTHKLFNCRQRSCDGGCQLLAAIEGAADDRDKERTWTGLEYGLRVSQQTHWR